MEPDTRYYYRVRATNNIGDSPYSNTSDATTKQIIGDGWTDGDVGTPDIAGDATFDVSTGTFTVRGSGDDIWNAADSFHFVYKSLIGDGTITARVTSETYTDYWAKAGVMIRETPDANSAYAFMLSSAGGTGSFQYRSPPAPVQDPYDTYGPAPLWVRVTRTGDNFTGFISYDEVPSDGSWIETASANIPMAAGVYAGLAVTSHNNTAVNTATFDGVELQQSPLSPPSLPESLGAKPVSGTQVLLTWTDPGHNTTVFTVQRSTGLGGSYTNVGTTNRTSFIDSGLQSGHTYYYRVSAANPAGSTDFTDPVNATPPIPPLTPSNGHATLVKSDEVDLAWTDNANNEEGYRIFRRLGSAGTFELLVQLPPDTQAYVDNTVPPATQVDYHIQAYNAAGFSDFTGVSLATPIGVPVGITTKPGNNKLIISWSKVNGAASYNVYRSTTPGGEGTTPLAANITGTSFSDTGVANGNVYYYQLSTNYSGGETSRSPEFIGSPGPVAGATARYFNNINWGGTPDVETLIDSPYYDWGLGSPDPTINFDNFSTEFTGKIHADQDGWYTLITRTDDDGFLWVNGQLVSQDPGPHPPRDAWYLNPIFLIGGQDYNFIFRQIEYGGGAVAQMRWGFNPDFPDYYAPDAVPMDHLTTLIDSPAQATDVSAPVIGSRTLTLQWTDNATSEYGYRVERSSGGGAFVTVYETGIVENYQGQRSRRPSPTRDSSRTPSTPTG